MRTSIQGVLLQACIILVATLLATAQTPTANPAVPDWALPASATHKQISPPADFHRDAKTIMTPIGIFDGQSDVGAAIIPGSSSYESATKKYTITSAGYNIWYVRDEFRYLWKKVSGDVSMAADIMYPDPAGYGDRKACIVIRQSLDDDAKQVVVALHGEGMIQLAWRPEKGVRVRDFEYRVTSRGALPGGKSMDEGIIAHAQRIGIEKRGDKFALFVSIFGEPMTQYGTPIELKLDRPFYIGIGMCSHVPDKADTAVLSNVVFVNSAGKVK
ncbi:hypothetical protein [Mucilaginibacter sp. HD30]